MSLWEGPVMVLVHLGREAGCRLLGLASSGSAYNGQGSPRRLRLEHGVALKMDTCGQEYWGPLGAECQQENRFCSVAVGTFATFVTSLSEFGKRLLAGAPGEGVTG